MTIVGLCVLVFIGQQASDEVTEQLAFFPVLAESEPWRFLTAAFAHSPSSFMHILFNMYALWLTGSYLEPLLGRARFLSLYLVSALGGSVVYLLLAAAPQPPGDPGGWFTPTVGASGAVFGLFGAMLVLNRHLGRQTTGILVILAINMVIGFVIPNIAWQAHLGGAVTGAAIALIYARTSARGRDRAAVRRRRLAWPALALVVVALVALSVWRISSVPDFTWVLPG
jgi:membrane associated rhomboid family serine protease